MVEVQDVKSNSNDSEVFAHGNSIVISRIKDPKLRAKLAKLDKDGDDDIDAHEVYRLKKLETFYKRSVWLLLLVCVAMLACIFGATVGAGEYIKEFHVKGTEEEAATAESRRLLSSDPHEMRRRMSTLTSAEDFKVKFLDAGGEAIASSKINDIHSATLDSKWFAEIWDIESGGPRRQLQETGSAQRADLDLGDLKEMECSIPINTMKFSNYESWIRKINQMGYTLTDSRINVLRKKKKFPLKIEQVEIDEEFEFDENGDEYISHVVLEYPLDFGPWGGSIRVEIDTVDISERVWLVYPSETDERGEVMHREHDISNDCTLRIELRNKRSISHMKLIIALMKEQFPDGNAKSRHPTKYPSETPTDTPSTFPTRYPSQVPSMLPSHMPSAYPTYMPSQLPSLQPSDLPSTEPTAYPTELPSVEPTAYPTDMPSTAPIDVTPIMIGHGVCVGPSWIQLQRCSHYMTMQATYEDCQRFCVNDNDCDFYNWNENIRHCIIYTSNSCPNNFNQEPGSTSHEVQGVYGACAQCPEYECLALPDANIPTFPTTTQNGAFLFGHGVCVESTGLPDRCVGDMNLEDCAVECFNSPTCTHFSHRNHDDCMLSPMPSQADCPTEFNHYAQFSMGGTPPPSSGIIGSDTDCTDCHGYKCFGKQSSDWWNMAGNCEMADHPSANCVQSRDYEDEDEECVMMSKMPGYLIPGYQFVGIDSLTNHLVVDGVDVESPNQFPNQVAADTVMSWTSYGSITSFEWEVCLSHTQPTYTTSHAATFTTGTYLTPP